MAPYFIHRRRIALFFLFFATIIVMMISVKIWVEPPVRKSTPLRASLAASLAPAGGGQLILPEIPAVFSLTDQ